MQIHSWLTFDVYIIIIPPSIEKAAYFFRGPISVTASKIYEEVTNEFR